MDLVIAHQIAFDTCQAQEHEINCSINGCLRLDAGSALTNLL